MAGTPLDLNWTDLMEKGQPADLEIIPSSSSSDRDNVEHISDHQLDEKIQRMQLNKVAVTARLSDGGAKYTANLNQLIAERDRRTKMRQLRKDADELQKPNRSKSSCVSGACNVVHEKPQMSNASSQSFAECFSKRIDDKSGSCTRNALNENPRRFSENMFYNSKSNGQLTSLGRQGTSSERQGTDLSSRPEPFQCPSSLSAKGGKGGPLSGTHKGISPTSHSPLHLEENLSRHFSNKRASSPTTTFRNMKNRKVQTLVVLDEEEVHPMHPEESLHQEDKAEEWSEDIKIYYPSRDDPECIDLCRADLNCLNPESPLSSTIMNFYIRYLQRPISATGKSRSDYHFFNTYFYKKLEDAISCKMRDKDSFYPKFRRWWKGINIFQKSYIFLPIHADEHWSLAIICMPPKDEDSGLLVLHLDSLGYHASSQIFYNIERYLIEEWSYLNQNADSQCIPISHKIWNKLSRRISGEIIAVPQQKNDYDCGLFVLYFIERFIEEAPERLRKRDLSMFGRNWFEPEAASKLRERIKSLLNEQFESARLNNSSSTSSSDE